MNADAIHPIVLVGGRSVRFGRDKLREPVGGDGREWLVDRPIAALRSVFGARVAGVGACDVEVAARFDRMIEDRYAGSGPAGGIVSALDALAPGATSGAGALAGAVCVLAGDMPGVREASLRRIVAAATNAPEDVQAVLARAEGGGPIEPCFGVYFLGSADVLREGLSSGKSRALRDVVASMMTMSVEVPREEVRNVNRREDVSR